CPAGGSAGEGRPESPAPSAAAHLTPGPSPADRPDAAIALSSPAGEGPGVRWALLAGILSGFALGTKATALVQFGLLGLALAWITVRSREHRSWVPVVAFELAAVIIGSPWYIKS